MLFFDGESDSGALLFVPDTRNIIFGDDELKNALDGRFYI